MKKLFHIRRNEKGQTLVEILVALAIAGILLPALMTAIVASREGRGQEKQRFQATALLREAEEAARSDREKGWAGFAVNGTYKPVVSGSSWDLSPGSETVNGFTRQIVISDVQRDSSGAIVTSGGTVDPSTKKVVTTVSWTLPLASSVSSEMYYQRYLGNAALTQTTQSEFNAGTTTNTITTATGGGQVELAPGVGDISWAAPSLAGSYNASGTNDATDIFVSGDYAYLVQGTALRIFDVSNPASPTLTGSYTASTTINDIYVVGDYAYLATSITTSELTVVSVANKAAPTRVGGLDLTSTSVAKAIYVDGNYAYIGRAYSTTTGANELAIVNITTPTAPTLSGSLNLTNAVNSIYVSGNYAYLATSITTAELTVANITNKAAPTSAGVYNASGTSIANDVFAVGTTVYLAKANNTSGTELFILNAANPASISLVGSYETGANINSVYVLGSYAFLATAITGAQFRVLNISNPSSPTVEGNYNHGSVLNDVMQAGSYAYLASASNSTELVIVQGTATSSGYQTSGTFESSSFDTGASVGFNYVTFTIAKPAGTDIQFQVATNNDNTTWNYVGPDGTASTYYTSPGAIPLSQVDGRYLRYKVLFTSTGTDTPQLSDVTINYSP